MQFCFDYNVLQLHNLPYLKKLEFMEECNLLHATSSTGNQMTPHKQLGELPLIFGSSIWFLTGHL